MTRSKSTAHAAATNCSYLTRQCTRMYFFWWSIRPFVGFYFCNVV